MKDPDIAQIAHLARLKLDKQQEEELSKKFQEVKEYFSELAKLQIDASDPRDESALEKFHNDVAVKSPINLDFSPYMEDGYFKVPKVIE